MTESWQGNRTGLPSTGPGTQDVRGHLDQNFCIKLVLTFLVSQSSVKG